MVDNSPLDKWWEGYNSQGIIYLDWRLNNIMNAPLQRLQHLQLNVLQILIQTSHRTVQMSNSNIMNAETGAFIDKA